MIQCHAIYNLRTNSIINFELKLVKYFTFSLYNTMKYKSCWIDRTQLNSMKRNENIAKSSISIHFKRSGKCFLFLGFAIEILIIFLFYVYRTKKVDKNFSFFTILRLKNYSFIFRLENVQVFQIFPSFFIEIESEIPTLYFHCNNMEMEHSLFIFFHLKSRLTISHFNSNLLR